MGKVQLKQHRAMLGLLLLMTLAWFMAGNWQKTQAQSGTEPAGNPLLGEGYKLMLPVIPSRYCGTSVLDDFSNPNSGWPSGQSGWTTFGYQDNQYRIYHQYADYWLAVTAGDVWNYSRQIRLEGMAVDDRSSLWGILFGLNDDWSKFYTFEIAPRLQTWFFFQYTDSGGWQLIDYRQENFIQSNGWNTVEIHEDHQKMFMVVNNLPAIMIEERSGRVGITGGAIEGLLDIRYDNYKFVDANCPLASPPLQLNGPSSPVMALERPPLSVFLERP